MRSASCLFEEYDRAISPDHDGVWKGIAAPVVLGIKGIAIACDLNTMERACLVRSL